MTFAEQIASFNNTRLPELLKELAVMVARTAHVRIEENFNEGQNPAFIAKKRIKSKSEKLYVNTGRLTQSFIVNNRRRENVFVVRSERNALKMEFGSSVIYAAVHEYGGGNNIPKRPYFAKAFEKLEAEDLDELQNKITNELKTWLKL